MTSQTAHTKYKWPPYDPEQNPPRKIICVRHCYPETSQCTYFTEKSGLRDVKRAYFI